LFNVPEEQPITSWLLRPLFQGKSVNTPAFIVAALSNEKLLRLQRGRKRGHQLVDPECFLDSMNKLATGQATPKPTGTPTKKKATAKKKAVSTKKGT